MENGPVANVTVVPRRLVLAGRGDSGLLRVRAHSAAGFTVGPEVSARYDERLVSVEPVASGRSTPPQVGYVDAEHWRVTALVGETATHVDFEVGEVTVDVVVTAGIRTEPLAGADEGWRLRTARATGRIHAAGRANHEPGDRDPKRDRIEPPPDRSGRARDHVKSPPHCGESPHGRADPPPVAHTPPGPIDSPGAADLPPGAALPPGRADLPDAADPPSDRVNPPYGCAESTLDRVNPPPACAAVSGAAAPPPDRDDPPPGRTAPPPVADTPPGRAAPPGAVNPPPGRTDPPRASLVELEYDFTQSTATRAVYADLPRPIPVSGEPTSLGVWIDADGLGAWPSLDCRDADGTHIVLRGDHLTWIGPRRCSMPVPPSVTHPLSLYGFYLAETRPGHRYRGRIGFGDITAEAPPPADRPTVMGTDLPFPVWYPSHEDVDERWTETDSDRPLFTGSPLVHDAEESSGDSPLPVTGAPRPSQSAGGATPAAADPRRASAAASHPGRAPLGPSSGPLFTGDLTGRAWRFAVLSDTQFVAARPDDALVTAARTMLRDIVAARPEFVLVNGDFVDEGSPADLALARRILDEELAGGPPWVYVPGNHEIAGGAVATFTAAFGPARRVFDHHGVRFLTLDTSSLRIGDEQLASLRTELERAAAAPDVEAVVVAGHVPPHDPTGHRASRLADRAEAAALEAALAGFAATGKGCAYLAGHAGVFATWLRDGVVYVVNGNSGKSPAAPPRWGGLLGWSECGVGTVRRWSGRAELVRRAPDWLAVRVREPSRPGGVTGITPVPAIGE